MWERLFPSRRSIEFVRQNSDAGSILVARENPPGAHSRLPASFRYVGHGRAMPA